MITNHQRHRRTDRRTDRRHAIAIPRFALKCIAHSRGKNAVSFRGPGACSRTAMGAWPQTLACRYIVTIRRSIFVTIWFDYLFSVTRCVFLAVNTSKMRLRSPRWGTYSAPPDLVSPPQELHPALGPSGFDPRGHLLAVGSAPEIFRPRTILDNG